MDAMVEMASVGKEQIATWLIDTAGTQEAAVRTATGHLEDAQNMPKFALCLLMLSAGGQDKGLRVAAATYLKNFLKTHWNQQEDGLSLEEKLEFRNQLVEVLLRVDGLVLKLLAENVCHCSNLLDQPRLTAVINAAGQSFLKFRLVAVSDFAKKMTWPELVPALKTAIHNSDLMNGTGNSELKTLNVLISLQTVIKPFQYFLDPTVPHEPVPEQLELISKELLGPLHAVFHYLVQQVATSKDEGCAQHDNILLVLCKAIHLTMKSHMPLSILACLGQWFNDLMVLLDTVVLEKRMDSPEQQPRLKCWKRALQICCNLVSRHRKHVDKYLPPMSNTALRIVARSANAKDVHPMQERIVSLAFDLVANILETGPGWRLMAPQFLDLVENAIFPALKMNEKDILEWVEDEDEYLRKNLPSDMDEASGWKEDLLTPRQSALNLLGLIATAKGPPTSGGTKKAAATKRKKGGKGKGKDGQGTAGEILVMPFLSQFPLPDDGAAPSSEQVLNYYGALMAYGGVHQFLRTQSAETVTALLQTKVFPLYSMVSPTPYVLANANWLLGELAFCLPEELSEEVYHALLKALQAPNASNVSWRPVRASAAAALSSLLQEDYKPTQWLPLLQATVAGAHKQEEGEATISLQLLATVAEAGEDHVAPHVSAVAAAVQGEISKHIPPHPEPWPQMVELGFAAVASLAQTWDGAEPDEDEDDGKALANWKTGCATVANTFSELLQRAWLMPAEEVDQTQATPPPSCLSDASVLLAATLRYTPDSTAATSMKVEPLLQVWANLVADWNAWEEEEDEAVFDSIEEAVALQGRCPMLHFTKSGIPPRPAPQVAQRSIIECLVTFLTTAIESGYPTACWRACRCTHALLHVSQLSFEGEGTSNILVPRFCGVATHRFQQLTSVNVPLAKPLILLIAMCFIILPEPVVKILSVEEDGSSNVTEDGASQGLLTWAEALAGLAESASDPGLSLESEMKLAVIGLQKVLVHMVNSDTLRCRKVFKAAHHCLRSLLEATVDLKELVDSSETDESHSESGSDDNEDDDGDSDSKDGSESANSNDEHEETEEEFLERYAKTARELQEEAIEEAENGQDEDGHEIELGVLALVDHEKEVLACLKEHSRKLLSKQPLPKELLSRFKASFPESRSYL